MVEVFLQRSQEIGTLELLLKKVVCGGSYTLPLYIVLTFLRLYNYIGLVSTEQTIKYLWELRIIQIFGFVLMSALINVANWNL